MGKKRDSDGVRPEGKRRTYSSRSFGPSEVRPPKGERHGDFRQEPVAVPTGTRGRASRFLRGEVSYRVLVTLLLAVVGLAFLAAPIKQLLDRDHANRALAAQIQQQKQLQTQLQDQLEQWDDPDFVAAQARERLGYLKPGQVQYVLVDPQAKYTPQGTAEEPFAGPKRPWFMSLNDSIAGAGSVPALNQETTQQTPESPQTPAPKSSPSPES